MPDYPPQTPPTVPVQPVVPQVPAGQAVIPVQPVRPVTVAQPVVVEQPPAEQKTALRIVGHSNLFYWWPVWAIGYLMALLTWLHGEHHTIGADRELYNSSSDLGVIFFLTLFFVILISNVSVRGVASALVVVCLVLAAVLLAWFGWWDTVLSWFGHLRVHLNLGAYLFFSTLLFAAWFLTVFVFDQMTWWRITPGQITRERFLGAGSKSYDTDGIMLEKYRYDLFRNWIIGLGSGDLRIQTWGANRETINIPNVLFVGTKVKAIQAMIAMKPDEFGHATVK